MVLLLSKYPKGKYRGSARSSAYRGFVGKQARNDITWWDLGRTSWQESDQLENFDRRSKFLEISLTTYIENKQYTEF
jgi:hypothetical protein